MLAIARDAEDLAEGAFADVKVCLSEVAVWYHCIGQIGHKLLDSFHILSTGQSLTPFPPRQSRGVDIEEPSHLFL
jgi:hypothetical protein